MALRRRNRAYKPHGLRMGWSFVSHILQMGDCAHGFQLAGSREVMKVVLKP